jgi:hypothetical protein
LNLLAGSLAVLAALLTLVLAVWMFSLHSSDAAGNGLAQIYTAVEMLVLWVVLGALLIVCAVRKGFPGRSGWWMLAFTVVADRHLGPIFELCLQLAIISTPALILARAAWGLFPIAQNVASASTAMWGTALPLVLLSLLPWLPVWQRSRLIAAARAEDRIAVQRADEEHQRTMEQVHEQSLANLRAMPAETPLAQVMVYTSDGYIPVRDAARERARTLANRQADAEHLLEQGEAGALREIAYLDLAPTPSLCVKMRPVLRRVIQDFAPVQATRATIDEVEWQIAPFQPSIEWLARHGCDCQAELQMLEDGAKRFRETPNRGRFLAWLAALKQTSGAK